jgi:hypothetical protein
MAARSDLSGLCDRNFVRRRVELASVIGSRRAEVLPGGHGPGVEPGGTISTSGSAGSCAAACCAAPNGTGTAAAPPGPGDPCRPSPATAGPPSAESDDARSDLTAAATADSSVAVSVDSVPALGSSGTISITFPVGPSPQGTSLLGLETLRVPALATRSPEQE